MVPGSLFPYIVVIILVLFILANAIRILREYERGVIFRLGRLVGAKGPGLILLIPIIDKMVEIAKLLRAKVQGDDGEVYTGGGAENYLPPSDNGDEEK